MIKKIKDKFMHWYTKPRYGKLFDFSVWVLENPKALSVALIMGMCLASVMFLTLFIFSIINHWFILFPVIFGVIFIMVTRMAYKNINFMRKTGSAFDELNIQTIMGAKETKEEEIIITDPNKKVIEPEEEKVYDSYTSYIDEEVPNYEGVNDDNDNKSS